MIGAYEHQIAFAHPSGSQKFICEWKKTVTAVTAYN